MKTTTESIFFALVASLAVHSSPIRPDIQELSSRSQVIGLDTRQTTHGDDTIARRAPSYQHRRDDITMIETRVVTTEDKRAANPLTVTAEKLSLSSTNATATGTSFFRGQPVKAREAEPKKTIEPNCFAAGTSDASDLGCVINLRG